jgi:DNA polymerase III delta subunit
MITWLVGENSFEIREALKAIEAEFEGTAEHVDGASLSLAQLPDLLMGISLFATERLVVIQDITTNGTLWEKLPAWLPRVNDSVHVVFIDTKPDKRTTSYKELKAVANLKEFPTWGERDDAKAEQWVMHRATSNAMQLDRKLVSHIVRRVGLDQWQLANALATLSLLDAITIEKIDDVIPPNPSENIFQLFETALERKPEHVSTMIDTLSLQEDPYALFALLSSQALTLATVTYADESANPAKDFAIHPFVASKLTRHGKRLGKARVGKILEAFARTDADMKRSKADPWVLIERLLIEVAQ